MKEIKLSQLGKNKGKFVALVDDEDFEYLNQFKWSCHKSRNTHYADRYDNGKFINMHRVIMNTPNNLQVDHIDHNGLNNQKSNLRNCTGAENCMNRKSRCKSKYTGVSYVKNYKGDGHYVIAQIHHNKIKHYLGIFKNEIEAAKAYNEKALELHGEFACLNVIN